MIYCISSLGIVNQLVLNDRFLGIQIEFGEARGKLLPAKDTIEGICNAIVYQRRVPIYDVNTESIRMPVVIGVLATQPGFKQYYADYGIIPDDAVEFRPINEEYLRGLDLDAPILRQPERYTRNEIDIIFGLLVLASNKSISVVGQQGEFITNRLSAMRNALKAIEFIQPDQMLELFTTEAINALSNTLAMFPRLKTLIYSLVLRHSETPIMAHLAPFLKGNQLTIFNMIFGFLTSYELTEAHIYSVVVAQAHAWFIVFNQLKARYGDHWPYAKSFEPELSITAQANWPVLAGAAYLHAILIKGEETMKNVRVTKTALTLLYRKVCRRIPAAFIQRAQGDDGIADMQDDLREFMHLVPNYREAVLEEPTPDLLETAERKKKK